MAAVGLVAVAAVGAGATTPASAAAKVGMLECTVSGGIGFIIGSQKPMSCTFTPVAGPAEYYTGVVRKFGLDIGVTAKTVILWAVLEAHGDYSPGSIAGEYGGVSAEASVGLGVGANALVGGNANSVALQPISVQGQAGVNLAVGVTSMSLRPAQ